MGGDGVAVHALGFFGVPLEVAGAVGDFALGFGQRLALFGGEDGGQVVLGGHHQLKPAAQNGAAFFGGFALPGRPGALGGLDGAAGFGGAHFRHARHQFASGRIGDIQGGAIVGIHPGAVDIALLTQQLGVFQIQHVGLSGDDRQTAHPVGGPAGGRIRRRRGAARLP